MPYLNVSQVESALSAAAGAPNQLITQLITLPNITWESRTCRAIKIASGTGPGRIGVYFIGGVHAREWGSPDILIFFIQQLTQAYRTNTGITLGGKSFTAAQIQSIVNELDIFIFPQVNPDGRNFSMTADPMWRKNRRPAPGGTPGCLGVDINRNYDFLWNYPLYYSSTAPVQNSQNPCDYQVYIGPGAASEPETKNVVSMLDDHPNIRFFVDVHSYSELILFGWGDDQDQTTNPSMNFRNTAYNGQRGIANDAAYREYIEGCDQTSVIALANRMRNAIQAVRGKAYTAQSSFDLYPTAGTSTDYAFSRHVVDRSKGKVQSFTIEWGQEFQPPYSEMQNIIQDVTSGLLDFCLGIMETHADVYIKDNVNDTGIVPYVGSFWDNSDVIVRQSDDKVFTYQPARRGQTNYIYVRVTTLGPSNAQDVRVTARAIRYPGTEFVYPYDWTTVDATHLEPTAIVNTFSNIPSGNTRIAKFSLSSAQVNVLWGWQSGGWHPCLVAEVEGCNDYGSPAGVHVWENNNLGQRNLSVVPTLLGALVSFPFLAGHVLNLSEAVELAIDRSELPEHVELLLDPFDRTRYFEGIPGAEDTPIERELGNKVTFLDRTRLEVSFCGSAGVLTLPPGSSFQYVTDTKKTVLSTQGAQLVRRNGRSVLALNDPEAVVRLPKQPGGLRQVVLHFRIPASAEPGDRYRVHVTQRDETRQVVGGVTLEVPVVAEDPSIG